MRYSIVTITRLSGNDSILVNDELIFPVEFIGIFPQPRFFVAIMIQLHVKQGDKGAKRRWFDSNQWIFPLK